MEYLKVDCGLIVTVTNLSDAECGRLFRSMLRYAATEEAQELRGAEMVLWPGIKKKIDEQIVSYRKICTVNRENALKGSAKKKRTGANRTRTAPNGSESDANRDIYISIKESNSKKESPKGDEKEIPLSVMPMWEAFEENRKKMRKPMTERARELLIRDLFRLSKDEGEMTAVLEQSVKNGWTGLFPLRKEQKTGNARPGMGGSAGYAQTKISDSEFDALFDEV